jgi:glycosyltransferase involved in cell wall biosynthesis
MKVFENRSIKYIQNIDSFVLLTKYMMNDLFVKKRPYVVIEGIHNQTQMINHVSIEKGRNKTILYSGTLARQYGIVHLLYSFSKINNADYRLWICGEGDAKDLIVKMAEEDKRIKYFGQLKREEVLVLQKKATALINPRFSDSEFTLYSFPSKTMEYLASGTPTIMHPLKCLPQEYLEHLYIASDESDIGLATTIVDVCEKSQEELDVFGNRALDFILKEKNSKVQVGKILDMINYEK